MVPVTWSPFAATSVAVPLPAKVPSAAGAPAPSMWTVMSPRWLLTPGTTPVKAPVAGSRLIVPVPAPLIGRSVPPAFASADAGLRSASASTIRRARRLFARRPA